MILFYDRTSSQESVNQVHQQLFTQKGRAINGHLPPMDFFLQRKLPPTQASWSLITQVYQSGHSWGPMMFAPPQHPSPSDWGQKQSSLDLITEATQAYCELLRCECEEMCRKGRGKCAKASLQCMALYYSSGLCSQK